MEHRITLSTNLLIAVRGNRENENERKQNASDRRMTASGLSYEIESDDDEKGDAYFRLYGLEHSKAV